jgi:uncharacterized low-complexity protein
MRRLACVTLLAAAFAVPAFAQDSGAARAQRAGGQAAEKAAKQKAKEGQDCDPNRAGVRCNKPKPKKVWFWGKA